MPLARAAHGAERYVEHEWLPQARALASCPHCNEASARSKPVSTSYNHAPNQDASLSDFSLGVKRILAFESFCFRASLHVDVAWQLVRAFVWLNDCLNIFYSLLRLPHDQRARVARHAGMGSAKLPHKPCSCQPRPSHGSSTSTNAVYTVRIRKTNLSLRGAIGGQPMQMLCTIRCVTIMLPKYVVTASVFSGFAHLRCCLLHATNHGMCTRCSLVMRVCNIRTRQFSRSA
jgi:hypothetical protein